MRVTVMVTPRARSNDIQVLDDGRLKVKVTVPPEDGRANAAVVAIIAKHFHVPKQSVRILHGSTGRSKLLEILT